MKGEWKERREEIEGWGHTAFALVGHRVSPYSYSGRRFSWKSSPTCLSSGSGCLARFLCRATPRSWPVARACLRFSALEE